MDRNEILLLMAKEGVIPRTPSVGAFAEKHGVARRVASFVAIKHGDLLAYVSQLKKGFVAQVPPLPTKAEWAAADALSIAKMMDMGTWEPETVGEVA